MGYTNYWQPKKLDLQDIPAQFWVDAHDILNNIISRGIVLANAYGEEKASASEIINKNDKTIAFNGLGKDSHETFCLSFDGDWNFCKTARKPYDIAVKAMLMLADHYELLDIRTNKETGYEYSWSFDGELTDEEVSHARTFVDDVINKPNNKYQGIYNKIVELISDLNEATKQATNEEDLDTLADLSEDLICGIPVTLIMKDYIKRDYIKTVMHEAENTEKVNQMMQQLYEEDYGAFENSVYEDITNFVNENN